MAMRSPKRTAAVAAILVVLASRAAAQETTGTVSGTVTDQTGAVLTGATVVVKSLRTGMARELVTNASGHFLAPLLPVGPYHLTVTLAGFQPFAARVDLHVNDRLEVDATLLVERLAAAVEVTAEARVLQPTPAVQSLIGPTQVMELPLNNRNFAQLATLVPGVSSDLADEVGVGLTSVMSVSVNGARRNAVNWLVDGGSNVDVGSNITLLATPTLESIEEFKIITSSYAAEWPRSGGGIVNVVTKSGTNEFRASAYEFFRSDSLNANSFFRKQSTDPATRDRPPELRYHNFGYTLGGPLRKDRLFGFVSQEWRRITRAPASVRANVPDPAWLTDPTSPNYVPPAERDPNAVRLLGLWPQPNAGATVFQSSQPSINNTRQEVARLDYVPGQRWRLMARYTHDLSETQEAGGLFFGTAVPNVATTSTPVPGHILVAQVTTTLSPTTFNELSYHFTGNRIRTSNPEGTRNKRADLGITIPELFPENASGLIPTISVSGLSLVGANQLYSIRYRNHTLSDNLTLQRGDHALKAGVLLTFESKDENSAGLTQGRFDFVAGGGRTAFQNFLRGNRDGGCGAGCTYSEAERDVTNHLRFSRYEAYLQDSWRVRPNLTVDIGLRYSIYPGVTDQNDVLTSFDPARYDPARAPRFANPAGTAIVAGTGDPLNGIVVAGRNSPYGRRLHATDTDNFGPRGGFSWDVKGDGRTVLRGGFGIYYDQPLVGIFEQNAFVNPPFNTSIALQNPSLANPAGGVAPNTTGLRNLIASSDPFATPRTTQWNVGFQRQLYRRGAIDVAYVGARGDNLIRPVDINLPQPQDVVRLGSANPARPYLGYGTITMRETTARSRFHGLLVSFRHDQGRAGTLSIAYTLSRSRTDATNDRDAVDVPQNPRDLAAEYALARTDRLHIFTATYVYELPFFRDARSGFLKHALGGWQLSGITTLQSGPPVPRILAGTNGNRRGNRANQVSDPFSNLPVQGLYWFNPAAFAPPTDGSYGNSQRAVFRLPGRNQWDLALAKNWYPSGRTRVQIRADFINALNHTQFTTVDADCSRSLTTCVAGTFGQITGARAPREIQLGLKFYWN
jgi:hypothetical protein